ncbi:MAG TPA: hypothetical protein VGJ52_12805, partial [Vicinamibacterales bacterium]
MPITAMVEARRPARGVRHERIARGGFAAGGGASVTAGALAGAGGGMGATSPAGTVTSDCTNSPNCR